MGMDTQSDTRVGDLPLVAGEDLTGMEGLLVVLGNDAGKPVVARPVTDDALPGYLLVEGAAAGEAATVRPMDPGRNVRIRLVGSCVPGDVLVLAVTGLEINRGKVMKLPVAAGTYRGLAIAEQAGETGQLVLARPMAVGNIEVV